jgi:hypothetical protein
MGRHNNTEIANPAVRFFEWAGAREKGYVEYYDKDAKVSVPVEMPFKFIILDKVSQVGGGIEGDSGKYEGFWSNAVKSLKTQPFVVKARSGTKTRTVASGLYENIKLTPGVKFITGLYIAFKDAEGVLQIGYLKLSGASLAAWFDFAKAHRNIYDGAFMISDSEEKKKGSNIYKSPIFGHTSNIPEALEKQALALSEEVGEYLDAYFNRDMSDYESAGETYTPRGGDGDAPEAWGPDAPAYSGQPDEPAAAAAGTARASMAVEEDW